ncbi:MAG: hypothetical protein IPM92_12905 [Saprospiraceae bacterium]|nr:hypothetical protein [Saprospiraceae bacterium]
MPSRRLQTLCAAIFLLCLWQSDKDDINSLWILIPSGLLVVASFIFADLVNNWWFNKNPPNISDYERNWLINFAPYYENLNKVQREHFDQKLARELYHKEFINMAEKEIPEEWKLMCLAPAIYLGLYYGTKGADHYNRIVFYFHQFPSPQQDYLHISETEHEDGVLIFSLPHLESAYLKPESYFNISIYEWGQVFFQLHKMPDDWGALSDEIISDCCTHIQTNETDLKTYIGQPILSLAGMLLYYYLCYNSIMKNKWPDQYQFINRFVLQ